MKHADVWRAIERLAASNDLSVSGLARRSGLDPTSFNKSKRQSRGGKARWPSTESIAKILAATNTGPGDFVALLDEEPREPLSRRFALVALSRVRQNSPLALLGEPEKVASPKILVPNVGDPAAFALDIDSDAYSPIYRKGDILILSPNMARLEGDRVALGLTSGRALLGLLAGEGPRQILLRDFAAKGEDLVVPASDVAWLARIAWARQ